MMFFRRRTAEFDTLGAAAFAQVEKAITITREVADSPDATEGDLRHSLRQCASLMSMLNGGNAEFRKHITRQARRFGWLTLAWLVLVAFQVFDLARRLGLLSWLL